MRKNTTFTKSHNSTKTQNTNNATPKTHIYTKCKQDIFCFEKNANPQTIKTQQMPYIWKHTLQISQNTPNCKNTPKYTHKSTNNIRNYILYRNAHKKYIKEFHQYKTKHPNFARNTKKTKTQDLYNNKC